MYARFYMWSSQKLIYQEVELNILWKQGILLITWCINYKFFFLSLVLPRTRILCWQLATCLDFPVLVCPKFNTVKLWIDSSVFFSSFFPLSFIVFFCLNYFFIWFFKNGSQRFFAIREFVCFIYIKIKLFPRRVECWSYIFLPFFNACPPLYGPPI